MGDPADPMAVVDPQGKVIGSHNIYVADASIMPRLPTANTNVPVLMGPKRSAMRCWGITARYSEQSRKVNDR